MPKTPKRSHSFEKEWAEIIKKTASDELFRQRVLKNPKQVLKDYGVNIKDEFTVKIIDAAPKTIYLTLPEAESIRDLSEEELREIAGGRSQTYILKQC